MEDTLMKSGRIKYMVRREVFRVLDKLSQFVLPRTIPEANENLASDGAHYVVEVSYNIHTLASFRTRFVVGSICARNFWLCFSFTGINLQGMLYHVCDVAYDENRCGTK